MAKTSRISEAARALGSAAAPAKTDDSAGGAAAEQASNGIAGMPYETALAELESLVQQVEDGSLSLEAGIQSHRRAVLLLKHCESILNAAQAQIEQIAGRDLPPASDEPD